MRRTRRMRVVARVLVPYLAIALVAVAVVNALATVAIEKIVRDQAFQRAVNEAESTASQVVAPLVTRDVRKADAPSIERLSLQSQVSRTASGFQRLTVSSAGGRILYSDDARQIGQRFPLTSAEHSVLDVGGVDSAAVDMAESPDLYNRSLGRTLEVSVGARDAGGRPILIKTYYAEDCLRADASKVARRVLPATIVAVCMLGVALVLPLTLRLASRAGRPGQRSDEASLS